MRKLLFLISISLISSIFIFAQSSKEESIKKLSLDKWQWMADKDVIKLDKLFDARAKFVHMSGT